MGLVYAGFAGLILFFLFWAVTDSYRYTPHAIGLALIVFGLFALVSSYAQRRGRDQKRSGETLDTERGKEPTSETRWENQLP